MRKFTVEERRARLSRRHHLALANRAVSATEVARDIVGLHSTDPATVFVAAWARMKNAKVAGIEQELYEDRSLVRVLVMRRTAFVLPPEEAAIALAACVRSVGQVQRRQLVQWIEKAGVAKDGAVWLRKLEESTFDAVAARGAATAVQVSQDVPLLRRELVVAKGTRNEARVNLGSFVLRLLAVDGRLMRGRPRGGWLSTQWSWATTRYWLGHELRPWTIEEAQADVRRALTAIAPVEVELEGAKGIALAGDLAPTRRPEPFAALLAGLDPSVMGWAGRDWYLGPHRAAMFDRSGNAGPTIWWDGRIVGGWAQRPNGEIVLRLLEDIGRDGKGGVVKEAERLRAWLGERRVLPRFSTPLVKELAAGGESRASTPRPRTAPRRSQTQRAG